MRESFGRFLRRRRRQKGLSQRALAGQVGVDFSYLSKLENEAPGFSSVSEPTLQKLAEALDVDADEMITRAGKVPSDVQRILIDDFSLVKEVRRRNQADADSAGGDP